MGADAMTADKERGCGCVVSDNLDADQCRYKAGIEIIERELLLEHLLPGQDAETYREALRFALSALGHPPSQGDGEG